jgi:hypothetical protein
LALFPATFSTAFLGPQLAFSESNTVAASAAETRSYVLSVAAFDLSGTAKLGEMKLKIRIKGDYKWAFILGLCIFNAYQRR